MSLATLSERLEFDTAERATWADVACNPVYSLVDKFEIINCSIQAEPLGDCGLTPRVPYEIDGFERSGPSNILVHFTAPLRSYQLPENYARMVSRRDIAIINSHLNHFILTRAVKHCGIHRLPFDDKSYTWKLVLKQLPRKPLWSGVPPL